MDPPNPALAVEARGLVKCFGELRALDGLSLSVERGAFFAFLGPNGAGKSTTLSVLTGVYTPDAGTVHILGLDGRRETLAIKSQIGVVPEELALFERLTGRQQLTFAGRLYGLGGAEAAGRAEELLSLTGLSARADALVLEYSKGMRRRLAIAAALIHAPRLVFLDEPFEGIDVMAAGIIRELLAELSRRHVTLVLTTHVLELAERLATHAGIILAGQVVDQGSLAELRQRHGRATLEEVFAKLVGVPSRSAATLTFYGPSR